MSRLSPALRASTALCFLVVGGGGRAGAQDIEAARDRVDRFQAAAASRAAVLVIQQAISSLPPTSGQLFTYELDPDTGVPRRSERLGPTVLRSTETAGKGRFTLRAAASYFSLDQTFGPTVQRIDSGPDTIYVANGSALDAKVGLLTVSLTYGLLEKLDAYLTLPIVASGTTADSLVSVNTKDGSIGSATRRGLARALASGSATIETFPLSGFDDGAHAGIGRINVGARGVLFETNAYRLAGTCDLYVPSPNEEQFAGSATTSILPRLLGSAKLADWLRLYADVGYDYDFDIRQLRRFTWGAGLSAPLAALTIDVGFGGSHYAVPIRLTPDRLTLPGSPPVTVTTFGKNALGTNLVPFLAGVKLRLGRRVVLSGAVSVPVTDPGGQPSPAGTIAVEVSLPD